MSGALAELDALLAASGHASRAVTTDETKIYDALRFMHLTALSPRCWMGATGGYCAEGAADGTSGARLPERMLWRYRRAGATTHFQPRVAEWYVVRVPRCGEWLLALSEPVHEIPIDDSSLFECREPHAPTASSASEPTPRTIICDLDTRHTQLASVLPDWFARRFSDSWSTAVPETRSRLSDCFAVLVEAPIRNPPSG